MRLELYRRKLTEKTTQGTLFSDEKFVCWTLEDKWRDLSTEPKVPKQTCIPEGHYQLVLDMSIRFGRIMPHILDVPNFTGIRIHPGNTEADTEGCILVGLSRSLDYVGMSRMAFNRLMLLLEEPQKTQEITLDVKLEPYEG